MPISVDKYIYLYIYIYIFYILIKIIKYKLSVDATYVIEKWNRWRIGNWCNVKTME